MFYLCLLESIFQQTLLKRERKNPCPKQLGEEIIRLVFEDYPNYSQSLAYVMCEVKVYDWVDTGRSEMRSW